MYETSLYYKKSVWKFWFLKYNYYIVSSTPPATSTLNFVEAPYADDQHRNSQIGGEWAYLVFYVLTPWHLHICIYCTRSIINRGLYIFYPIFEDHFFVFKGSFSENSGLMYG